MIRVALFTSKKCHLYLQYLQKGVGYGYIIISKYVIVFPKQPYTLNFTN